MITVDAWNDHPSYRISLAPTVKLARRVLLLEHPAGAECSIVYIGDRRMIALNTAYLGHRRTTDVLSFPLGEPSDRELSGEVYVNLDQAVRQAGEYGVSAGNEVARLVVHGLLHLSGYDDGTTLKRKRMSLREDFHLARRGIPALRVSKRNLRKTNGR